MMFMLNTSLSLQIIALVAAAFLFSWGLHKQGNGTGVAKFFGLITTLIALFSLISSLCFAVKLWQDGRMMREGMHPMPQEMQTAIDHQTPGDKPAAPAKKK